MGTSIRATLAADYPAVERLAREILVHHATALPDVYRVIEPALPVSRFIDLLADPSSAVLVAEHDGKIAGYAECSLMPVSANPAHVPHTRAMIETIVVAAEMRGRGIGRKLLDACVVWAKEHGADALVLHVWEFNEDAIAFYERHGMAMVQRRMMLSLD